MERYKKLNIYQKCVLIFMIAVSLTFAVIYFMTTSKVGFEFKGAILTQSREDSGTVYSGTIHGKHAQFTISDNNEVVFQYGGKTYGPYTVKEDPTAIPKSEVIEEDMIGMEVYQGEELLFRGGVFKLEDYYMLTNEDGSSGNISVSYTTADGIERDENGYEVDPIEPSVSDVLQLMDNPKLTHKGDWMVWFAAVFIYIINAVSIIYADELFRWRLSFRVRDAYTVEPSGLEIAQRYIIWTLSVVVALALFIFGLQ